MPLFAVKTSPNVPNVYTEGKMARRAVSDGFSQFNGVQSVLKW